jgi:hypothetical protein
MMLSAMFSKICAVESALMVYVCGVVCLMLLLYRAVRMLPSARSVSVLSTVMGLTLSSSRLLM